VEMHYWGPQEASGTLAATEEEKIAAEVAALQRNLDSIAWKLENPDLLEATPENSPQSLENERQFILDKIATLTGETTAKPKCAKLARAR